MRVNEQTKSMDIEARDVNYILPSYIRLYLFQTRNVDPEKIIFPMYRSVPHPFKKEVMIPIEYVPDDSPVAVEIMRDGSNVTEATEETETAADKKEKDYDAAQKKIRELEEALRIANSLSTADTTEEPAVSPAKAAFAAQEQPEPAISGENKNLQPTPDRVAKAKTPSHILPPGTASDYGGKRDSRDQKQIAKDLRPEKEINEEEEKEDNDLVKRVKGSKK